MAGLTREQRAAKEAAQDEQRAAKDEAPPANVWMVKDGQEAEVANNESVAVMQVAGWKLKG